MTDEEMAEEYKESKRHKCFRADVGKIQIDYEAYLNNLKDGFLAGLKAGRPQWHKVADGDLPKGYCLVFYKDTSGENSYSIVHPSWYIAGIKAFFENNPRIIAWCEIPTFDKE